MLIELDRQWALYEKSYVFELMVIEKDARRFVTLAIQQEKALTALEQSGENADESRKQLIQRMCEINPVVNIQGKGRDDFTMDVISRAEALLSNISMPRAVRKLSE